MRCRQAALALGTLAAAALFAAASPAIAGLEIAPGLTRDEVIARIGEPSGELDFGERHVMIYDGAVVELTRGFVVYISPDFEKRGEKRQELSAFEESQRAKGLELFEGRWLSKDQIEAVQKARTATPPRRDGLPASAAPAATQTAAPASAQAQDIAVISDGGKQVDLSKVTVAGKVTIVDFYADWCGPCRRISPDLEKLARNDPDVVLRKIDIVRWGTPVTAQHSINSVPNIRVYGRDGRMVGSPSHSLQEIERLVRQAK
jgi:thiol-disulfide isomerase/thioredoxin